MEYYYNKEENQILELEKYVDPYNNTKFILVGNKYDIDMKKLYETENENSFILLFNSNCSFKEEDITLDANYIKLGSSKYMYQCFEKKLHKHFKHYRKMMENENYVTGLILSYYKNNFLKD